MKFVDKINLFIGLISGGVFFPLMYFEYLKYCEKIEKKSQISF